MSNDIDTAQDAWATDRSSGFLQNFDGTVIDAYFGTDPRYNQGTTLLMQWECSVDEAHDDVDEIPEEILQKYPCGSNWETEDGGRTASHTSGKPNAKFHASTLYGKIIDEVVGATKGYGNAELAAGGEVVTNFDGLMDVLRKRGNPTQAEVWKGLRFRFAEVIFDYGENKKTGERMVSRRSMPVEFLGVAGEEEEGAAPRKAAAKKAAPAKKAVADKIAEAKAKKAANEDTPAETAESLLASVDGVDDDMRAAILAVLAEAEDHSTFVDSCLEIDGVTENDALLELIVDENIGLWPLKGA